MAGRLQEIFENAVGLQGPAREEYLNSARGADVALRAEVAALLQVHDQAPKFLASPTAGSTAAATIIAPPSEQEGQMIGRYKLLQPIGEGGFGSVWMAEQREPVKRRVALKIIKLGMDTKQVIARFEAERQALAMMDHPNIAKVLDAGATETGRPYFVMEYIKGVPILEYCDTERLDTRARLDLFTSVCHAIQHAHQKGIIHRDIKPSNVLITMHDGVPVPKVIDFGIAKATNTELTQKTLFTEHRQMIGTPAYMSPEQAEMSGLDIDTRSDVYSLGVLLYELLTGTTPFATEELMSKGFAEMMRIIREVEPHKPSTRLSSLGESGTRTAQQRHVADPKKLGLIIKGDLDWIVMKCLEKDRTRRYETANGLAADIQRHLDDEPVAAGPPSASYKLRKFVKRNRGQVIAVCVLTVALLAAFVGASWGLVEANRARSIRLQQQLENEQRTAADNARLARNAEAVTALLSQCEEALRAGDAAKAVVAIEAARKRSAEGGAEKDAERLSRLSRDLDLLVDLDAVDQVRWGWTVDGLADSLITAAIRNREALKKFGVDPEAASVESMATAVNASVVRERIVAAVDRLLWASRPDEVTKTVHGLLRRLDPDPFRNEVRDTFLGRIAASEAELKATGAKLVELAMRPAAMEQPAAFAAFLGDFNVIPMTRRVELLQAAALRRPKDLGVLIYLSNFALGSDGHSKPIDLNEALRWSQAAVAADPTNAAVYNNLGVSLLQKGRVDEAVACYQQAIAVDPKNGMAYGNLGNALEAMGRTDEAIAHHRKAVELDPKHASGYFNLANTLSTHGQLDEAVGFFRKAIEINPQYSYAYYGLGTAQMGQGKLAEALDAFKKAIECNPRYLDPHVNAGTALNDLGRLDEAIVYFTRAIELDPKCAMAQANLGAVLSRQGRYDEAIAMCGKAIESDPKLAQGYYTLAGVYAAQGPLDDAVANFRKAIECDPNHADAHCNLAQALQGQGHYEEALAEYKRGHELGSARPGWNYPSAQWIRDAEAKIAMAAKLPAFLRGEYQPSDNAERLEFAYICQNTKRYHAATGVFAAVLAADPKIGENFEGCVRYNAACVAALSAAGKGEDAANLGDQERARLRKQAHDWLRADLDDAARKLESGDGAIVPVAMRAFVQQADLVSIRDAAARAKLPADEQETFTQLWADVAALLARATPPAPPTPTTARAESPDQAVSNLEKTLKQRQATLGPDHRDTLIAMGQLAMAYEAANRPDLAVPLWEETLRLAKVRFGVEDPFTLDTMRRVGAACWFAKQLDKSVPLFEECLKLHKARFGRDDPTTLGVMADLGVNYKDAGRPEDAIPLLEEALRAATDHPELGQYGLHLLDAYAKAADPAKPETTAKVAALVQELLAAARATLPKDSPELAARLATFSMTLLAIKAWDEAEPLIREALTIREAKEPNDWRTSNTKSMLGGALLGQKKLDEAEPLLLEGYTGMKDREAAIPTQGKVRIPEALERLVRLYEAKGNDSEAAAWRSKLDAARAKMPQASGTDAKKEAK